MTTMLINREHKASFYKKKMSFVDSELCKFAYFYLPKLGGTSGFELS